jgi:hypothetical protein
VKLLPLALLGLGLAAVAGEGKSAPPDDGDKPNGGTNGKAPVVPTGERAEVRENLRGFGQILEINLGWEDLEQFLDATAYTESRWLWRPKGKVPKTGSNKAVGPYQMRPNSAGDTKELRDRFKLEPWLLEHPTVATAAIVAYLSRMGPQNVNATQEQARASFAYPVFIHGRPNQDTTEATARVIALANASPYKTLAAQQKRYDLALENFREALAVADYPAWLASTPIFPSAQRYKVQQLLPMMGWPTLPPVGVDPWDW